MLIFFPPLLHLDRWLKQSVHYAMIILILLGVGMTLFFFIYPWDANHSLIQNSCLGRKVEKMPFPYEAIGTGGLALYPHHALGWVSRLADELNLLAYNSRPDCSFADAQILIALRYGKQQFAVPSGKILYLQENEEGKGLHLSETSTHLGVKPILLENGAVHVEAKRKLIPKEGESKEEVGQFMLATQGGVPSDYNASQLSCVKELKSACSYSQDVFIQKYGGKEYSGWKDKICLEMTKGQQTYALFLSVGDFLQYSEDEWHVVAEKDLQKSLPIASIKGASGKSLDIQAWDETGFYPVSIQIELQKPAAFSAKSEAVLGNVRFRSKSQVSCTLGKRRMIIKQGDWLLKTATGWRNLRKAEEIQDYLCHRLKGELFVFDAIETEQGHSILKGHLFDPTRTQLQTIVIPLDAEKTQGKTSRKRIPKVHVKRAA